MGGTCILKTKNEISACTLIFVFFLIPAFLSANEKPLFLSIIDINANPFFYEPSYNIIGLSLNGSIQAGIDFQTISIALFVNDNYFICSGQDLSSQLNAYWNVLQGTVLIHHSLSDSLSLHWGLGAAWILSSFNYNLGSLFTRNEIGPSAVLNLTIATPFSFLDIGIINKFDLFFNTGKPYPYYYGGVRFNIHPFTDFFNLYLEPAGLLWLYEQYDENIFSGIFLINIGFSMDISGTFKKNENNGKNEADEILKENKESFDLLESGNTDTIIHFKGIIFKKRTIDILEQSLPVISKIADILKNQSSLVIAIRAYSDNLGDPVEELELITQRGKIIKQYLIKEGIEPQRIKILESGNIAIITNFDYDIQDYSNVTVKIIYR
ncbi:MAG: OmpA family protein [Spirochaetales bacterium]|nr:OmpA family protein [Spirochaetales bacterium]